MYILTFDTTLDKMYLTFSKDEKILTSKKIESNQDKYHSAYLTKTIANILKENKITMQEIGAIGVNVGPGSFTGIRACVTVARVIAQQINAKLIGVSSLEILSKISGEKKVMVLMDARKNCAYQAIYEAGKEEKAPCVVKLEELSVSDFYGCDVLTDKKMSEFLLGMGIKSICYQDEEYELGEFLAKITYDKIKEDKDYSYTKVKPLYLQPPPVTLKKGV